METSFKFPVLPSTLSTLPGQVNNSHDVINNGQEEVVAEEEEEEDKVQKKSQCDKRQIFYFWALEIKLSVSAYVFVWR